MVYIGYIVDIQNLIRNEILKIILFFHFIILSNIIILHLLLKKNFISKIKHFDTVMKNYNKMIFVLHE